MPYELLAASLGAAIGAVLALTGAGGGILAVPLLVFGLGMPLADAAPVGLLAVGLAAALGAILGLRQGIVRYRAAGLIAAVGLVMVPPGLYLAHHLPNAPLALVFAGVLLYASLRMLRKARAEAGGSAEPQAAPKPCVLNPAHGRLRWTLPCARALAQTGALAGLLSGMLGVGGGFVIVPALQRCTDLAMESIVATSLAVIALVSLGGVASASLSGVMNWQSGGPFAAGAVLGLLAGRQVAHRIGGPGLQRAFAIIGMLAAVMLAADALGVGWRG